MSTVYVINDCGKCGYQNGRLVVEVLEKRTEIPFEKVSGMLIIGNIQLSTQLMKACLKKGVVVTYLSKYGEFYGKLHSTKHQHILRNVSPIRGRKPVHTDCKEMELEVKKHLPNMGSETSPFLVVQISLLSIVKKHLPNKGSETRFA